RYQDLQGKISSPYTATITLTTVRPVGSIQINGGAALTRSTAATLALSASSSAGSIVKMQFSKDGGASWFALEPYASTRNVTLSPAGDGLKSVAVRYLDALGNLSQSYSASITLDTTGPTGSIVINGGAATTASQAATLTLA